MEKAGHRSRQELVLRQITWLEQLRNKLRGRHIANREQCMAASPQMYTCNTTVPQRSCKKAQTHGFTMDKHIDSFSKALDDEGLLKYSNPVNKMPVLTVCYDFLDTELSSTRWTYQDEKKYRESLQHLDKDKQERYMRLFSTQYPMEHLVDGLPESVWLECVEPTLTILKAINSLKRRKSNLTIRKSSMTTVDSCVACHGDFASAPFIFNPFLHGQRMHLMRVQFLALEGVQEGGQDGQQDLPPRDNQNNAIEAVEQARAIQPATHDNDAQRRRRLRQFRPYNILDDIINNVLNIQNNALQQERDLRGI